MPFEVDSVPFIGSGTTVGATKDYFFGDDECPGESMGLGEGSSDQVYAFNPPQSGNYQFLLESDFDAVIYLVQDCGLIASTCLAASDAGASWIDEEIVAYLKKGSTAYLIVDGYSNWNNTLGDYTLTIEAFDPPGCNADCGGKACGQDGCGGQCGLCEVGEVCGQGQCQDPAFGSTCGQSFQISIDETVLGNTSVATNDYHFDNNTCPGVSYGCGEGGKDQVWRFEPDQSGTYTFELDADFDSAIYVVTDCSDIKSSCLGAKDKIGMEILDIMLDGLGTYYVIVDSYSNFFDDSGPYTLKLSGP
jgi:hypothetical protein